MKQELKDAWVAALRSGKYNQFRRGWMWRNDASNAIKGYCCLTVLLAASGKSDSEILQCFNLRGSVKALGLPEDGESNSNPDEHPGTIQYFVSLNDRHSKTFAEIADAVEQHVVVTNAQAELVAA